MPSDRTCSRPECERPLYGRGLCKACYEWHRRRGSLPEKWDRPDTTYEWLIAFCESIDMSAWPGPNGPCVEAPWRPNGNGYPTTWVNGRTITAGHVTMEETGLTRPVVGWTKDRPAMMLHSCDNRACVAPWHLSWGTPAGNVYDMATRGRHMPSPGERNGRAKIDRDTVRWIRRVYVPGVNQHNRGNADAISAATGLSRSAVVRIATDKQWTHVLGRVDSKPDDMGAVLAIGILTLAAAIEDRTPTNNGA